MKLYEFEEAIKRAILKNPDAFRAVSIKEAKESEAKESEAKERGEKNEDSKI